MRICFETIRADAGQSFRMVELQVPRFNAPWHFHPEIELGLILESRGRRFVGDSIEPFTEGDLVLLGPNLPHFWHNEGQKKGDRSRAVAVQFRPEFLGSEFLEKPEMAPVKDMFKRAARGLHFAGTPHIAERLEALPKLRGSPALPDLLAILQLLASCGGRPLANPVYSPTLDRKVEARLARVYSFLMARFREPLTLPQIAGVAAMSPAAFSRYFKRVTGRNVFAFINELRVDHTANKLAETNDAVAEIAYQSGFMTLPNFNRRFKERLGCSPREYRQILEDHMRGGPTAFDFTRAGPTARV
jgi:AraC-like DNA-binding protein